jgi:integration host factor subunit alpha
MTKSDLINKVYEKVTGLTKKEAAHFVNNVIETIKWTLESGEDIKISGFGNFILREKEARPGRNPKTGKNIEISARRVVTFRASQILKDAINQNK